MKIVKNIIIIYPILVIGFAVSYGFRGQIDGITDAHPIRLLRT